MVQGGRDSSANGSKDLMAGFFLEVFVMLCLPEACTGLARGLASQGTSTRALSHVIALQHE